MRTIFAHDENFEPTLIHIVAATKTAKFEHCLYFTKCGETLEGQGPKVRTSRRIPTCLRCLGTVIPAVPLWP